MKNVINLDDLSGLPTFAPPKHSGTLNHRLAHSGNGATQLAIWHGTLEPGGEAEEHVHEKMDQAFYVIGGQCRFWLGGEEHRLAQGGFVFVPMGAPHRILAGGADALKLLVIIAPPPDENPVGHK